MGRFRLILSLLVVGSHVGSLGYAPSGGTAIAGFFTLSGFLMARTITANYGGTGFLRYYGNRAVRILPPYLAVALASWLLLLARDSVGFQLEPGASQRFMPIEIPSSMGALFNWSWPGYPLYLTTSTDLLPQAWSLMVEGVFYLLAPLLVALASRRLFLPAVLAVSVASYLLAQGDSWLRSPVASLWVFNLGIVGYFLSPLDRCSDRTKVWCRRAGVIPLIAVFLMGIGRSPLSPDTVFRVVPFLVTAWLVLGQWSTRRQDAVDQQTGNLAYGVFLGHYVTTLLGLWVAEAVFQWTGHFGLWGGPNDWTLILANYTFAILGGAAIYYGVEHPFERLRARLRSARRPEAPAPAPALAS